MISFKWHHFEKEGLCRKNFMSPQKSQAEIPLSATMLRDRKIARKYLIYPRQHADLFSTYDEVRCLQSSRSHNQTI